MKFDYITTPADTPESRNDDFYDRISSNWRKKARDLQERRWEKIEHKQKNQP